MSRPSSHQGGAQPLATALVGGGGQGKGGGKVLESKAGFLEEDVTDQNAKPHLLGCGYPHNYCFC